MINTEHLNIYSLTTNFYQNRIKQHYPLLDDRLANDVGWMSRENQLLGFEIATNLSGINWPEVDRVLDVGCGYGFLSEYLRDERGFRGTYIGIDLMSQFVEKARVIYGNESRNEFREGNFIAQNWLDSSFDVVISLGSISVNYDYPSPPGEKSLFYARKVIELMCHTARLALSIYFPSGEYVIPSLRTPNLAYYQYREIENIIKDVCQDRLNYFTIDSFPNNNDTKTMARVYLNNL